MVTVKKKSVRKKKLNKNNKLIYMFLFVLGFLILIYPLFSQYYYSINSNHIVNQFDESVKKINNEELNRRLELAKAYNSTLDPTKFSDPYGEYSDKEKEGIAEYARMLEVKEMIGYVQIPKIEENLPIYAGTSESVLQKGAGHLEGSSLPIGGDDTHSVITAHRGLAKAKMFRRLDELEIGDVFFVKNIEKTLAYKVDRILTVEPTNFEPVLVEKGKDYCTLLTCTPYVINSHRLLVRGHRIDYTEEVLKVEKAKVKGFWLSNLHYLIIILLILLIMLYFMFGKRKYNGKKKKVQDR